jgi:urease accessory protein
MITYTSIVGRASDPRMADALHALEHRGRVDTVMLAADDIRRHRLRARTQGGDECGIALDRQTHLFDGAVLHLDAERALVVRTEHTRWLRLRARDAAAALELGYFAGNMHWAVRFAADVLEIALKGPLDDYLARLAPMLDTRRVSEVQQEHAHE